MNDLTPPGDHQGDHYPFLDSLLRDVLPEIKLALGQAIDRENARAMPSRYARLLPETLLVVTLRPDAADAITHIAPTLERELTDSCTRHGSLYDRGYRVQLRRSEDPNAPLYRVSAVAGRDLAHEHGPHEDLPAVQADRAKSASSAAAAAGAAAERGSAADQEGATLPSYDPDATRIDDAGPPGWQPGRWLLLVQNEAGEEQEVFRLTDPLTTVGRRSDDPDLRTTVAISDAPHVSRRQLALLWQERDGAPGFRVFNLGLNPVHLPGRDVEGAQVGKGQLNLDALDEESTGWLPPGVPLRIGDRGPTLQIEEVPEEEEEEEEPVDPDATVHE